MNWNRVAGKLLERAIEARTHANGFIETQNPTTPELREAQNHLLVSSILTYLSEAIREGSDNGE
jgi:hypothetical protein